MNHFRARMLGQTTMVMIMLVIILFAGTVIFLLTFAKDISQSDYMNYYTHSLLLSVMRSDTGHTDPECRLVSDTLACAFFTPDHLCGSSGISCMQLANQTASLYIERFSMIKKSYHYLLTVEPDGFSVLREGEPFRMLIGNQNLSRSRTTKYAANEQMRKATSTGIYNLKASLVIAKR